MRWPRLVAPPKDKSTMALLLYKQCREVSHDSVSVAVSLWQCLCDTAVVSVLKSVVSSVVFEGGSGWLMTAKPRLHHCLIFVAGYGIAHTFLFLSYKAKSEGEYHVFAWLNPFV